MHRVFKPGAVPGPSEKELGPSRDPRTLFSVLPGSLRPSPIWTGGPTKRRVRKKGEKSQYGSDREVKQEAAEGGSRRPAEPAGPPPPRREERGHSEKRRRRKKKKKTNRRGGAKHFREVAARYDGAIASYPRRG